MAAPTEPTDRPDLATRAYGELVELLGEEDPDVHAGKMFGMPIFLRGRKAFGGPRQGDMVFKLTGSEHAEALRLRGAHLFDPGERGRPMKQWVVVPAAHAEQWERLARAALADVKAG
jgi:hypothetical protein